jgi:hypothetical protein
MATTSKKPSRPGGQNRGGQRPGGQRPGGGGRPGGGNKSGGRPTSPELELERAIAAKAAGKAPRPDEKRDNGAPQKPVKAPLPQEVIVGESITVRDLATLMQRSPIDLIKILMQYGIMAPITHTIDHDTAVILGEELGVAVNWPAADASEDEIAAEAAPPRAGCRAQPCPQGDRRSKRRSAWSIARPWWPCWAMSITARPRCSTASATRMWPAARPAALRSAPAPIR